jgi:3-hydroxyacyl-CoA dehydrogenase
MQSQCKRPERILVGHPFNPPHLIPLVEVVGGTATSAEALQQAMRFYASIGKKPILLRKEMPGHVANRLQLALYREVLYLVEQDVLSVADADAAVSWGPGLRWALMGPSLQYHVSGGAGGIQHFLEGVFEGLLPVFKTLGDPKITSELKSRLADGTLKEAGSRSIEQLTKGENEQLVALLKLRAEHP